MNKDPIITVCITTYNRNYAIDKALKSAVRQQYPPIEFQIVDDGSTDNTYKYIKPYLDKYSNIDYIKHDKNKGLAAARNTGWKNAKGKYVAFLDDDDMLKPDSIKKKVELYESLLKQGHNNVGIVYSGAEVIDTKQNKSTFNMPILNGSIREEVRKKGLYSIPSTGIHLKEVLQKIGGFDENMISFIDHDLWMNLAHHNYSAYALYEPLTLIKINNHKKSMVTNIDQRLKGIDQFLDKWDDEFQSIMGKKDSLIWKNKYKSKILGFLAAQNTCNLNFNGSYRIINKNLFKNYGIKLNLTFFYRYIRSIFGILFSSFNHK